MPLSASHKAAISRALKEYYKTHRAQERSDKAGARAKASKARAKAARQAASARRKREAAAKRARTARERRTKAAERSRVARNATRSAPSKGKAKATRGGGSGSVLKKKDAPRKGKRGGRLVKFRLGVAYYSDGSRYSRAGFRG